MMKIKTKERNLGGQSTTGTTLIYAGLLLLLVGTEVKWDVVNNKTY